MKFSRKIMRAKERADKKVQEQEIRSRRQHWPTLVWAVMIYKCADCGYEIPMYLEHTLERHNGDAHKPVPFGMVCPECGGFHCYDDIPRFRELPGVRQLREGESYFKDDPNHDCGIPIVRR